MEKCSRVRLILICATWNCFVSLGLSSGVPIDRQVPNHIRLGGPPEWDLPYNAARYNTGSSTSQFEAQGSPIIAPKPVLHSSGSLPSSPILSSASSTSISPLLTTPNLTILNFALSEIEDSDVKLFLRRNIGLFQTKKIVPFPIDFTNLEKMERSFVIIKDVLSLSWVRLLYRVEKKHTPKPDGSTLYSFEFQPYLPFEIPDRKQIEAEFHRNLAKGVQGFRFPREEFGFLKKEEAEAVTSIIAFYANKYDCSLRTVSSDQNESIYVPEQYFHFIIKFQKRSVTEAMKQYLTLEHEAEDIAFQENEEGNILILTQSGKLHHIGFNFLYKFLNRKD